ncbi:MAG TPA: ketoacyl-ACP synthase III [Oscillospiraceae bacterium]|nr:ketoacyl-ACP synthase III [Oscillospiraceae bacterium]
MTNCIDIKSLGVYHPKNKVSNEHFIKYYQSKGKDIVPMLNQFGRNSRYLSDNMEENTVTMAANACKKALKNSNLSADDIDLLIFSSGTPEYLAPANAIKVHELIGGRDSAIAYDMNSNCVGMIIAIEQASRYMQANPDMKYALVVGSEQMNRFSQYDDAYTKTNFGDAACAVILVKTDIPDSGFQDATYHMNSTRSSVMLFPKCGLSNIYNKDIPIEDKKILWTGGTASNGFVLAKSLIEQVLEKKKLDKNAVKKYFISQVCRENIEQLANSMGINPDRFEYVGDKYGYTGTSSPFVALNYAIQNDEIHRGDNIVFWSVGTGYISCAMLWKY